MNYNFIVTGAEGFLDQVHQLIDLNGEVLVVHTQTWGPRYRAYAIICSMEELFDVFGENVARLSNTYVLCEKHLPVRGVADDALFRRAIAEIEDGNEWVLLSLETSDYRTNQYFEGDRVGELEKVYEKFRGQRVAFGKFPFDFDTRYADSEFIVSGGPLTEIRIGLERKDDGKIAIIGRFDWSRPGKRTKLGGEPEWIQSDYTPICECCEERMTFIAQIDSIDIDSNFKGLKEEYMFGDVGMIYVFYCFDCLQTESVFQCY